MATSFTPNNTMLLHVPLFLLAVLLAAVFVPTATDAAGERVSRERQKYDEYIENWCYRARDQTSCQRVLSTVPELEYKLNVTEFVWTIPHVIARKTAEDKALADAALAAAEKKNGGGGGAEIPRCLATCAASLSNMSKVFSVLPDKIDDKRYPEVEKFITDTFQYEFVFPPAPPCQSSCPDKTSSREEVAIADKFHDIWSLIDTVDIYIRELDLAIPGK